MTAAVSSSMAERTDWVLHLGIWTCWRPSHRLLKVRMCPQDKSGGSLGSRSPPTRHAWGPRDRLECCSSGNVSSWGFPACHPTHGSCLITLSRRECYGGSNVLAAGTDGRAPDSINTKAKASRMKACAPSKPPQCLVWMRCMSLRPLIEHDHLVAVLAVLACTRWCSQVEHCPQLSTGLFPARPSDVFLQR